jgi:hypothetical protein
MKAGAAGKEAYNMADKKRSVVVSDSFLVNFSKLIFSGNNCLCYAGL